MADQERATITLYIDPESYEQESGTPLADKDMQEFGREINEMVAHFYGYESWKADMPRTPEQIKARLEYLRGEIEAERISYGEIAELQSLSAHIDPGDALLPQWAGVEEVAEEPPSMAIYRDLRTGFHVEIDGEYGSETTGVYLHDAHGEIVCWVNEEWESEPSLVAKIVHAIASGFTEGPDHLREWMNRPPA